MIKKIGILFATILLINCNLNNQNMTIEGSIVDIKKVRLGKGYYKSTFIYSYNYANKNYIDSTTFWKGNSKLIRVNIGDNVELKITYNKTEIIRSELLESNFRIVRKAECFMKGQYSGNHYNSIAIYKKDTSTNDYKFLHTVIEKGPLFYGWNKVFIKRKNNLNGETYPLSNCEYKDGIYYIESENDSLTYKFVINPNQYLEQIVNNKKYIYYFNQNNEAKLNTSFSKQ